MSETGESEKKPGSRAPILKLRDGESPVQHRAENSFRRSMATFSEYRTPKVSIRQLNQANQQIVNNGGADGKGNGRRPAAKALPAIRARKEGAPEGDQEEQALAAIDRTPNRGREKALEHERPEARGAERGNDGA